MKAELDSATVLRVYEAEGAPAATAVEFLWHKRTFQSANLLAKGAGSGERGTLRLAPHEIGTVLIKVR